MISLPFSIIIPVYNDENNISRCLESVISQSFCNYECLIIDDGSTDSTSSLCDEYSYRDKRIKTFHKKNEGISKTRQYGIDRSQGKYIVFIDSDDWINNFYIETIYNIITISEPDIIFFDFYNENIYGLKKHISFNYSSLNSETITMHVLEGKLSSCLWNIAFKNDFYLKINIKFNNEINYGEDTLFIIELLLNNPLVDYIKKPFYNHTYNINSYTRKNKKNRYFERIKFLHLLPILLKKYNKDNLNKYNFFPYNDKFTILCSGVFTKKEYRDFYLLKFTKYHRLNLNIIKYYILYFAENGFYVLLKHSISIFYWFNTILHKKIIPNSFI